MEPVLDDFNENEATTDTDQEPQTDTDRTDGEETTTTPSQSRSSSIHPQPHLLSQDDVDVFDGYSFKGRHSVLIDDEEEEDSLGEESIEEDEDNQSILDGLEEEAAQIGIVDDISPSDSVLLEDGAEPKTPEARPAAPLPPVTEVAASVPVDEETVEETVIVKEEEAEAPAPATPMEETREEPEVEPEVEEVVPDSQPSAELDATELIPVKEIDDAFAVPTTDVTTVPATNGAITPTTNGAIAPTANDAIVPTTNGAIVPTTNGAIVPTEESTDGAIVAAKESNGLSTPPPKAVPSRQTAGNRSSRSRREKSGVPALDRYLSDAIDEATEAERDEEDDDWDFVEAADGEDRNGTKGTSLFARGVVDRYRLAVFRIPTSRSGMRSVSGMSNASGSTVVSEMTESPSPSQRRGRTPGLTFRKNPRQFLRPKSPPSSFSAKTARSLSQSASSSIQPAASPTSSGGGRLLSASHSMGSTFALSPSLKSKESAMSVGAQSQSSDQSANGVFVDAADTIRGCPQMTTKGAEHKVKNKKLRRYKHNAEKVFSLFSSPRQAS